VESSIQPPLFRPQPLVFLDDALLFLGSKKILNNFNSSETDTTSQTILFSPLILIISRGPFHPLVVSPAIIPSYSLLSPSPGCTVPHWGLNRRGISSYLLVPSRFLLRSCLKSPTLLSPYIPMARSLTRPLPRHQDRQPR